MKRTKYKISIESPSAFLPSKVWLNCSRMKRKQQIKVIGKNCSVFGRCHYMVHFLESMQSSVRFLFISRPMLLRCTEWWTEARKWIVFLNYERYFHFDFLTLRDNNDPMSVAYIRKSGEQKSRIIMGVSDSVLRLLFKFINCCGMCSVPAYRS